MNLRNFGFKNYKSVGEEGVEIGKIDKINIFIGKNNSGKSNILRFIKALSDSRGAMKDFPFALEDRFRRLDKHPVLFMRLHLSELGVDEVYSYNGEYDVRRVVGNEIMIEYNFQDNSISTSAKLDELPDRVLLMMQRKFSSAPPATLIEEIKERIRQGAMKKIREFNNVIYIPHFRMINEGLEVNGNNADITGANIISKMFEMQNPGVGEEGKRVDFEKIQSFVRSLIQVDDMRLEIPYTKDRILINMHGNRLPLDSFGTGIHQLVLLCSILVIHNNHIVCIEEPEIHLHPELQRKFIDFLINTQNTYFITTHSNVFLDFEKKCNVYHVLYNGFSSSVNLISTNKSTNDALKDLGYRASDLLQANGVIWVEGPSDRVYIKKWIELMDNQLIEGLHYSVMFYGGRNLANVCFDLEYFEEELIPLLKINKNAVVVIDRDGTTSKAEINRTKRRIKGELGELNCWITQGREIENYISDCVLTEWVRNKRGDNSLHVNLGIDDKIEDKIFVVTNKIRYERNKNKFSKEISNFMTLESLTQLDLRKRVTQLVTLIREWNSPVK